MSEAWVVRESERQTLLENLMRAAFEKEREAINGSSWFFLLLSAAIIRHLLSRRRPGRGSALSSLTAGWLFLESVLKFFTQEVLPKIQEFSRTESEADALLVRFLERILQSGLTPFPAALMREEIFNPQEIFLAPSAMSEMPHNKTTLDN